MKTLTRYRVQGLLVSAVGGAALMFSPIPIELSVSLMIGWGALVSMVTEKRERQFLSKQERNRRVLIDRNVQ